MFFFSLNVAITGYINSNFLETLGWSNSIIGSTYSISSLLTLVLLPFVPRITNKIGNVRMMLGLLSLSALSILGIILGGNPVLQLISFTLFLFINFLVIFEMDVFLDHFSDDSKTGQIRGLFFTLINLTWAVSPLIAGFIIGAQSMLTVYAVGITSVLASLLIVLLFLRKTIFEKRPIHNMKQSYFAAWQNSDLRNIFSLSTMLHIGYVVSMIYLPLYLYTTIGFSWIEIGLLILIANIPFLVLGYPIGYLADTYLGEQELLITGLIIAALGTIGFSLITAPHFIAWAIVFLISRIGMSMIETTTESFLFKNIEHDDTETLSIQRNAIPVGYLVGPLIGFMVSLFTESYEPIFIILAGLFICAIYPASQLNDTK